MLRVFYFLILLLLPTLGFSKIYITINESVTNVYPIAVLDFTGEKESKVKFSKIIANDMRISGQFRIVKNKEEIKGLREPNYPLWAQDKVQLVILGEIVKKNNSYSIRVQLYDSIREVKVLDESWDKVSKKDLRRIAHKASDAIYERITGVKGVFSTKIAYVVYNRKGYYKYRLEISDLDGENIKVIVKSRDSIRDPSWSSKGRKIAYSITENKKSKIYIYDFDTKRKSLITNFTGINSSPTFSPDGKHLAFVLSLNRNPDIYVYSFKTKKIKRLTFSQAIDTEPEWASDSQSVYFTSDRRGGPQIFNIDLEKRFKPHRITFVGNYNARVRFSEDGNYMTWINGPNGVNLNIAIKDLRRNVQYLLTDDYLAESPDFAPNGDMVIYSLSSNDKGLLGVVSVRGQKSLRISVSDGNIRDPSWGPMSTSNYVY